MLNSDAAASLTQQIVGLIHDEDFSTALDHSNELIELQGQNPDGHVFRAICLARLGRADDATFSFRRALSLAPLNSKALYNYALHLYETGDLDESQSVVDKLLEANPNHEQARDLRAVIEADRPARATEDFGLSHQETAFAHGLPVEPRPLVIEEGYQRPMAAMDQPRLPWVEDLQPGWDISAWITAIASFLMVGPRVGFLIHMVSETGGKIQSDMFWQAFWSGGVPWLKIVRFTVMLWTILWLTVETIHRNKRPTWVFVAALGGILGIECLILPLYILLGRNERES